MLHYPRAPKLIGKKMATLAVYRMFVHKRGELQLGLEKARPHSKQHSKQSATRHAHGLKTVDELIWWLALLIG